LSIPFSESGCWRSLVSAAVDPRLLEILVCPLCKGALVYRKEAGELICKADRLAYPIKDGIPVMLEDDARKLDPAEEVAG
jgi:uncharacterized protein YbaR (Trm112 family)